MRNIFRGYKVLLVIALPLGLLIPVGVAYGPRAYWQAKVFAAQMRVNEHVPAYTVRQILKTQCNNVWKDFAMITKYQDAVGSKAVFLQELSVNPSNIIRIYRADGQRAFIYPGPDVKHTGNYDPKQEKLSDRDPATLCRENYLRSDVVPMRYDGPGEDILGYRTVKLVSDTPSGKTTQWLAPDLGCVELKHLTEFRAQDPKDRTKYTDQISSLSLAEAVEVRAGNPDASAFDLGRYARFRETPTREEMEAALQQYYEKQRAQQAQPPK